MALYRIRVNFETVVLADHPLDAVEYVENHLDEIIGGDDMSSAVSYSQEIKSKSDLPCSWDGACIPWGKDDDDRTIGQIMFDDSYTDHQINNTIYRIVPGENAPCDLYAIDPDKSKRWIISGTHTQCSRVLEELTRAKK